MKVTQTKILLQRLIVIRKDHFPFTVHIPFCHKLCYFCGCNKVITRHQHKADIYLDYLEKEIKARSELFKNRVATQVHWGGGTPTYLTEEQSARLMKMLKRPFYDCG